jgi:hypothetical protein
MEFNDRRRQSVLSSANTLRKGLKNKQRSMKATASLTGEPVAGLGKHKDPVYLLKNAMKNEYTLNDGRLTSRTRNKGK